jgi:hypothetical protein
MASRDLVPYTGMTMGAESQRMQNLFIDKWCGERVVPAADESRLGPVIAGDAVANG